MIQLRQVNKAYDEVQAVTDVSFTVEAHTAMALVGPSGSGKSTVLRLIAGLERPDSGHILIGGRVASTPDVLIPPHARGIGMVFQQPALWPHLTVARNVAFGLSRWPRQEAQQRTLEVLRWVGLEELASRYPHQLSGGEAQRVALGRALAPRPQILLLDEPLANLDPELHADMLDLIRTTRAQTGVTLILVSHNPAEAVSACPTAALMERGRVVRTGTWAELGLPSGRCTGTRRPPIPAPEVEP